MTGVASEAAVRPGERRMRILGGSHLLADLVMASDAELARLTLQQITGRRTVGIVAPGTAPVLNRRMDDGSVLQPLHHIGMALGAETGHPRAQQTFEIRLVRIMAGGTFSFRHRRMDILLGEHFYVVAFGAELCLAVVRIDKELPFSPVGVVTGGAGPLLDRGMYSLFLREGLMAAEAEGRLLLHQHHARLPPKGMVARLSMAVEAFLLHDRLVGQSDPLQGLVAGDAATVQGKGIGGLGRESDDNTPDEKKKFSHNGQSLPLRGLTSVKHLIA